METKDWKISISQDEMEMEMEMKMENETYIYKFIEDKCHRFCDKCRAECQIDSEAQSCKFCDKCSWHYCALLPSGAGHCRPRNRKDGKTGFWKKIKNK